MIRRTFLFAAITLLAASLAGWAGEDVPASGAARGSSALAGDAQPGGTSAAPGVNAATGAEAGRAGGYGPVGGTGGLAADREAPDTKTGTVEPLVFERRAEPREKAFTVVVPKGWKTDGGMFHVNPLEANGPGNSIDTKCDFTVKKDDIGTVYIRWLPSWNYADLSSPQFAMTAGFFPPGSSYQGMPVRPMPNVYTFLQETFRKNHPKATGTKVTNKQDMPDLADLFRKLNKPVNDALVQIGMPPMAFHAGGIVVDYNEGGVPYRESLLTVLVDNRVGAASWSNQYTLAMRAPAVEVARWQPVLEIIRQSLQFNPQWVAAATRAAGERAQMAQETMRYIQRVDQEIFAHRAKTNAEIRHEDYLFLTGQEEFVNPYTKEVERDTDEYKYRWTNFSGDRIYSEDRNFDPNKVRELSNVEWKLTPVRER